MNAQQLDLDQYQIALSKQLSAEIKGLLDQLGVTDQIEPLDLFEISADEYTLSDELSKTLVVIRPQPQILTLTIDDEECQYVLPSSDGFGAGLAYAFSIDSLEKSQAAGGKLCSFLRFNHRHSVLGVSSGSASCRFINAMYGTLLDQETKSPIESLSAGTAPIFCLCTDLSTPVTHSINAFKYSNLEKFKKYQAAFEYYMGKHGNVEPVCVVERATGSIELTMIAKLTKREISTVTGQHWAGDDYSDLTARMLEPINTISYGNNFNPAKVQAKQHLIESPEPQSAEPVVQDAEPELPEPAPQITEPEPQSDIKSSEPAPQPKDWSHLTHHVEHVGASDYRLWARYSTLALGSEESSVSQQFLVFEYAGRSDTFFIPGDLMPILLSSYQANTELTSGGYRLIEERFCYAPADLFGFGNLCERVTYLPGSLAVIDSTDQPAFWLCENNEFATHVLIRLETDQKHGYTMNREFRPLSGRFSRLRNGLPRLVPIKTIRQDACVIAVEQIATSGQNIFYILLDLELSHQLELVDPELLEFFKFL